MSPPMSPPGDGIDNRFDSGAETVQGAGRRAPTPMLSPGDIVGGNYEILSQIGAGGMGSVFEARDRQLNRVVAIKAAHPDIPRELLQQEAQILAAFRHPGLTTIFAFGTQRGIDYLVMEKLPGITLADHIERRGRIPFSVEEVLEILMAVGETLTVLHCAGLAHRDLKPSNIMLAGRGRVVLLDCGIARQERFIEEDRVISGSPNHMAPETVRAHVRTGEAHLVDLYGLAIVAFELLTLQLPFEGGSTVEMLRQRLLVTPPRVSTLRPDVPPQLDALIAEMLERNPEDRPPTVEVVNAALRTIRGALGQAVRTPVSVLVCDDDPSMREVLSAIIQRAVPSAEIRHASDGIEAIKLLQEKVPDLMFLDLQMPAMNGAEVCMYLRGARIAERTTIVVLTADLGPNIALVVQLGVADTYLSKTDHATLASKIKTLVLRVAAARGH